MAILVLLSAFGESQTFGQYTDFYDFQPTTIGTNGQPVSNVPFGYSTEIYTFDSKGNLYGVLGNGAGEYQRGMLFELTSTGVYKDLHDFGGTIVNASGQSGLDGMAPMNVSIDSQGNLYGIAQDMLWEYTKTGNYKDLHDFDGLILDTFGQLNRDSMPRSNVIIDPGGNLYGTCMYGGDRDHGLIWEMTASGIYKDIIDFGTPIVLPDGTQGTNGEAPYGNLVMDSQGNFYGTASHGGYAPSSGSSQGTIDGVLWECGPGGGFRDLYFFGGTVKFTTGATGQEGFPGSRITIDPFGDIYGTTIDGGAYPLDASNPSAGGLGIIWKLTSEGVFSDVHDFGGSISGANGVKRPDGGNDLIVPLISDLMGNLYGVSPGSQSYIVNSPENDFIFELTSSGQYLDLHDFGGPITLSDGQAGTDGFPTSGILIDPNGNLVGAAYPVMWRLPVSTKLKQFSISPASLVGGNPATGTITLANSVPTVDTAVSVASASSAAQPVTSVKVPAGQTTVTFPIATQAVATTTSATLTAKLGTVSLTGSLTIQAPTIKGFSVSPSSVIGGSSSTGTVTLNGTAPAGGIAVALSSGSANVSVPTTVTVPPKASSATFTIKTTPVAGDTSVAVKASTRSVSLSSTLLVRTPLVSSISLSPTSVFGGASVSGVVVLGSAAPVGGISVTLSSNSSAAVVPATVLIPSGGTQASFTVTTNPVPTTVSVVVEAQLGSSSRTTGLIVRCPVVKALALSPASLVGGTSSTATVTLGSAAPSGGLTVSLASSSANAQVPNSVVVAAGATTGTFTVNTNAVSSPVTANISAKNGSSSASSNLAIKAPTVMGLSLTPTSVSGSSTVSVTGTVTISSPAPTAGFVVSLSSSDPSALSVPTTVKVPSGATSVTFSLVKSAVSEKVVVTITATGNGTSRSASETVTP